MKYEPIVIPKFPKINGIVDMVVAIDISGSTVRWFTDVIRETMKQLLESLISSGSFRLTVWSFNHVVQYKTLTEFTDRDYLDFENKINEILIHGGGGSSYDESFYFVKALSLNPSAMVFITDSVMMEPKNPADIIANSLENYVILLHDVTKETMLPIPFKSHIIPLLYLHD